LKKKPCFSRTQISRSKASEAWTRYAIGWPTTSKRKRTAGWWWNFQPIFQSGMPWIIKYSIIYQ
jgi:hypothetical protein